MRKISKLQLTTTAIQDVLILEPRVFGDDRGWFTESFNAEDFRAAIGLDVKFVQDNHSFSRQGTLRGLHYQINNTQGKLVRVTCGNIFDVIVDLRKTSPSYGKWVGIELSSQNHKQIWAPPGVAHGFLVLSETAETLYKVTEYYDPSSEISLLWNDSTVNVNWPISNGVHMAISPKDALGLAWADAPKFK